MKGAGGCSAAPTQAIGTQLPASVGQMAGAAENVVAYHVCSVKRVAHIRKYIPDRLTDPAAEKFPWFIF